MTSHLTIYPVYFEYGHNVFVLRRQHVRLSDIAESLATTNVYILSDGQNSHDSVSPCGPPAGGTGERGQSRSLC